MTVCVCPAENASARHGGKHGGVRGEAAGREFEVAASEAERVATAWEVFVVADGGVWIWKIQCERFGRAQGVLDCYHASQHLWAVARSLHAGDEAAAQAWVEPLLSQLKHGLEAGVLPTLGDLPAWCAARHQELPPEVERERTYFETHRDHLHYAAMAARGCPNGSGAMESFYGQLAKNRSILSLGCAKMPLATGTQQAGAVELAEHVRIYGWT